MSFEETKKLLMEAIRIMADATAPTSNNSSSQGQGTRKDEVLGPSANSRTVAINKEHTRLFGYIVQVAQPQQGEKEAFSHAVCGGKIASASVKEHKNSSHQVKKR